MVHLVEESCSALTERVQKISEAHTSEDIWRYLDAYYFMYIMFTDSRLYGEFTMETILATAFGYKVELLRGKVDGGDELIKTAQDIFSVPNGGGMVSVILFSLNCQNFLSSISFITFYMPSSSHSLVDTSHAIPRHLFTCEFKICILKKDGTVICASPES